MPVVVLFKCNVRGAGRHHRGLSSRGHGSLLARRPRSRITQPFREGRGAFCFPRVLDGNGGGKAAYQARERYWPVSVLIRSVSPMSMKGGTLVLRPVSMTASLVWLVAVAPLMPGGVSLTTRSTVLGSS